jgi:Papain family cysteine protease
MEPKRPAITAGELREQLRKQRARWRVSPKYKDTDTLAPPKTGYIPSDLVPAAQTPRANFAEIFRRGTANPHLLQERITKRFISAELAPASRMPPHFDSGGPPVRAVDWRSRWGWPWITQVRNQNPCDNCWVFASTALVESMARIEHAVWAPRSEGDVLFTVGSTCDNSGNMQLALDDIIQRGIADRDCVPWVAAKTAYQPTADREGRTVKIPQYQVIGNIDDQKTWLETVGPVGTAFYVWKDFAYGYDSGVYHRDTTQKPYIDAANPGDELGWHAMLVVGFDDAQGAWIVKNSWSNSWGLQGFAYIGYGEAEIDTYAKIGLQHVDVDPWSKRRLSNGNLVEGDSGELHTDFDMLCADDNSRLRHWRRENSSQQNWKALETFASDVALFRPSLIQSTYGRNFETVFLNNESRLHHFWYERATQTWNDGGSFGPTDAAGIPGFMQSDYSAPGNFEVVVRTKDKRLSQWWREGGSGGVWVDGGKFARDVAFSGASLVQLGPSAIPHTTAADGSTLPHGDFALVCVLESGAMQYWRRKNDAGGGVWIDGPTFGTNVASPPCMIESQYGAATEDEPGNLELCVAVDGQVQHWWRDSGDEQWRFGTSFGHDAFAVTGLIQSSYGFALELIILRYDFSFQHYWRDEAGWHEGPIITPVP